MEDVVCKRYEFVEQSTNAAQGSTLNFPLLQQLSNNSSQDIIIQGIEFFSAQELPTSPTGGTVLSFANFRQCFLTLYVIDIDQAESVRRIPLIRLKNIVANQLAVAADSFSVWKQLGFENLTIIWEKSYIELAAGWPAGFSVCMGVYYKKLASGAWARIRGNKEPGW